MRLRARARFGAGGLKPYCAGMAHRLSAVQAHLNPLQVLPAASATLKEAPRKPLPLYNNGVPTLLTEEQKYEFVSSTVACCGQ